MKLSNKEKADFFKRCFTAVDGLWFVKTEEKYGFEKALKIDQEVWKVMPKIQARELKKLTGMDSGLEALLTCLSLKLDLEGYQYSIEKNSAEKCFSVIISQCPWHKLMVDSNRGHLSARVGSSICSNEFPLWASEFKVKLRFALKEQLCQGAPACMMTFY